MGFFVLHAQHNVIVKKGKRRARVLFLVCPAVRRIDCHYKFGGAEFCLPLRMQGVRLWRGGFPDYQ